jgi:hypothetical protein
MKTKLIIDNRSYKIGLDEVGGLKTAMSEVMSSVQEHIKQNIYWNDVELIDAEYKSRDGFIANTSNCGGLYISVVIPKCESYEFDYLSFGECDECINSTELDKHGSPKQCGFDGQECASESEGHLDAHLKVWLKFEGIDEDGLMSFYLVLSGGNGDAPYFREKYQPTLFETEFTAKSIAGFKRQAAIAIKKLLKVMK